MIIINKIIEITTTEGINIHNITLQIQEIISSSEIQNGQGLPAKFFSPKKIWQATRQVLVFSRHTTTALAINENEERLLQDAKVFLQKIAPQSDKYLHNDLHLRENIPPDEPRNAHSHLMAMMLSSSEVIPIVDGKLALGTYQSVLFFELDGARKRTIFCQLSGIS
ncbi:MAG: secondary thiamine-phosphate synthase enzyme YjbQ [Rivularia sp. (in: cyanobacteria)]